MNKLKVLIISCLSILLCVSLAAKNLPEKSLQVKTISTESTELVFKLPVYNITSHFDDNKIFNQIEISEGIMTGKAGYPELPVYSATIAIPFGSNVSISDIVFEKVKTINDIRILPVQNYQSTNHFFDYDSDFYDTKSNITVFPETSFSVSDVQTIRDMQVISITINPMRYFPSENKLEVTENLRIKINHQSHNLTPSYTFSPKISKAFEKIYENLIDNYEQVRVLNPVYQEPSLLIIYGGTPDATLLNNLVVWKKQRGYHVQTASTATTGTTTSNIKNYIQNAYNTWDNPPEFVMIIGDTNGTYAVPTFSLTYGFGSSGAGDYPYTHMSIGGVQDLLGDIFIGRLSVENNNHLTNMINKILQYEKNPLQAGTDWFTNNLLVGDSQSSGISTYIINRYIKSLLQDYDPAHNFTELYSSGVSATTMQNTMSSGILHFNYRGYIGMSGFSSTNVSQLTNVNKLTNCNWITCSTGAFTGSSIIEDVTRHATTSGGLAGAITAVGMSTSTTHTAYNNALNGAIFYGLYPADMPTMGQALLFSKLYLISVYGGSEIEAANSSSQWLNLMGDPSLNLYKTTPKTFSTSIPQTLSLGSESLRLVVKDNNGNNIPDAWVTISKMDGSYISKALSNHNGIAFLEIDPQQSGTLAIVISKEGFAPKIGGVTTQQGSKIGIQSYTINDINGNNNQQINPGESISLNLNIKNYTSSNYTNLNASVSSESEYVSFTNSTFTIGTLNSGQASLFSNVFMIHISSQTPDKILLPFTITIASGSGGIGSQAWTSYITPQVKGIDINIENIIYPNSQNYVDYEQNSPIYFSLKNTGNITANNLNAILRSGSSFLIVPDSTAYIGNVNVGQTVTHINDTFTIFVSDNVIPGMRLDAKLIIYNSNGYEEEIPIKINIGNKDNSDPTGPCDYGYFIYDCSDLNYDDVPVYNWQDIKNIGQNTGIADVNGSQEEDSETVTLPFTASYYGQQYSNITICSNGWLVFGQTAQKDFRNLLLPGPIAPKAMIAPYWTDLVVGGSQGGGVYTYHNQQDNTFIIQWDKAKLVTGYSGGSVTVGDSVSFQVIIYDPLHHSTINGDSPIKIQYRRFLPGIPGSNSHPFNYITVGFQDHTEKKGLTYVYNNEYSAGSTPLTSGKALYITQTELSDLKTQRINMTEGWNIFSVNISPENINFLQVTEALRAQGYLQKIQNEYGNSLEFMPHLGQWVNNIGNIMLTEGYRTRVNSDCQLRVKGNHIDLPLTIDLTEGWNLISFPYNYEISAMTIFNELIASNKLIKVIDESGQSLESIPVIGWVNNIGNFKPGKGYAVKVNQNSFLTYSNNVTRGGIAKKIINNPKYWEKVWSGNGLNHFNLFILTDNFAENTFKAGDEIAVFDGDICVGLAVYQEGDNYLSLISSMNDIYNEKTDGYIPGNNFSIKVYFTDTDEIQTPDYEILQGTNVFQSEATSVIRLLSNNSESETNNPYLNGIDAIYPNPFNPETNINFSVSQDSYTEITIFNIKGQKVKTLLSEFLKSGNHQVSWSGEDNVNNKVSSGVYFVKFTNKDIQQIKKILLIK